MYGGRQLIEQQQTPVQMAVSSSRSSHVHSNTVFPLPSSRLPAAPPSLVARFSPSNSSANKVRKSDFGQNFDAIQPKGHHYPHCPPPKMDHTIDHTDGSSCSHTNHSVQSADRASLSMHIKAALPTQITVYCPYKSLTRKSPSCAGVGICKGSGSQASVWEGGSDLYGSCAPHCL